MQFSSFYTGFFVRDVEVSVEKFKALGFEVKHKTGGDGYAMYVMELPKGDRIGVIQAPPEMGTDRMITLINVNNIEEATGIFVNEYGCARLGNGYTIETTKFQNVSHGDHLITLMEHIK